MAVCFDLHLLVKWHKWIITPGFQKYAHPFATCNATKNGGKFIFIFIKMYQTFNK